MASPGSLQLQESSLGENFPNTLTLKGHTNSPGDTWHWRGSGTGEVLNPEDIHFCSWTHDSVTQKYPSPMYPCLHQQPLPFLGVWLHPGTGGYRPYHRNTWPTSDHPCSAVLARSNCHIHTKDLHVREPALIGVTVTVPSCGSLRVLR